MSDLNEYALKFWPDKFLKTKCREVLFADSMEDLVNAMFAINAKLGCLGLAANQIGVDRRVFVMRIDGVDRAYINPVIFERSNDLAVTTESCFSFPGKSVQTRRPNKIYAGWYDLKTKDLVERYFGGLEAVVFQHEFDHLQGKTMFDRAIGAQRGFVK